MACCVRKIPIRGVLAVIGGFIIHLTIGTQLTYGNTNPYFVSYIRQKSSPSDLKPLGAQAGSEVSCLLGCWILSAGVVLTYWSLKFSYVTSVLTYGVMFGLGCGIAYPMPVTCAMRIITLYLNPDNLLPDLTQGEDVYFTQDAVLERVPSLFLVLGGDLRRHPAPDGQPSGRSPRQHPHTTGNEQGGDKDTSFEKRGQTERGEEKTDEEEVDMDIPPLQMLRNKQFYLVWLLILFGGMGGVFMASMYKSYGQSFIKDDQFIAVVGSCAAVFNALGGLVWGHLADRFSFHVAAKILYAMFACTSFTFVGSEYGLKSYFLVWVSLILFVISGKFTIMPPLIARMFGNKYMSVNYGLLYTSQILTAAASAFMGEMLKDILHYNGLFFLIGGMSCIGFVITFFVDARTPDGKKI
ncbi:hypothetical protein ACOMHN_004237 [Nucella lapillus]